MEEKINKKPAYILMTVLVMLWGFDYVVAKTGLEVFKPMSLLFCKYSIGFVTILTIKLLRGNFNLAKGHTRISALLPVRRGAVFQL